MDTQAFLENFGHIANSPGGVRKIREMILQFAVSGDLTNRIDGDIPALDLFQKIQNGKECYFQGRSFRSLVSLESISESSFPWRLPKNWLWCRIGDVTNYGFTDKAEFSDVGETTWILELEDIEKDSSLLLNKVRAKDRIFKSSKNRFSKGDILYGKLRPYLDKVLIADESGVCTTEIIPITAFDGLLPEYLRWYLKTPHFKNYATNSTHGMNLPRLGTDEARNAFLALPPYEEQKAIVAKINELMALCDRLERQQMEREKQFPIVSQVCHQRLIEEITPENLHRIFDEIGTISPDDLRKTILTLAVQGKLIPQDSLDEPARELLKNLAVRQSGLIKEGRVKEEKTLPPVKADEIPYKLPEGWEWVRFFSINQVKSELVSSKDFPKEMQIAPDSIEKGRGTLLFNRTVEEAKVFGPNNRFYKGQILYSKIRPSLSKAVIAPYDGLCSSDMYPIETRINHEYLLKVILSEMFLSQVRVAENRVKMPKLNLESLGQFVIPVPPLPEQHRIVSKINQLITLVEVLESKYQEKSEVSENYAKASVAYLSGIRFEGSENMKAPKTELISMVKKGAKPGSKDVAPLAALLNNHRGEMPAKTLWQESGLPIDAFYQQLKIEIANGWLVQPEPAEMKEIEES